MPWRVSVPHNYRKTTREHVANSSTGGRTGVRSYLGHWHTWRNGGKVEGAFAIHFVPRREQDRACTLLLDFDDVAELFTMCDEYLRAMNTP